MCLVLWWQKLTLNKLILVKSKLSLKWLMFGYNHEEKKWVER